MRIIGITGGIGSGKSTVSDYMRAKGFRVFDADLVSRRMTEKDGPALNEIREVFGEEAFLESGELDRKKLAEMVFSEEKNRLELEGIVTRRVIEEMRGWVKEMETRGFSTVFLDAPLLFESGLTGECDSVWVVACDDDIRIERIVRRGGIDREDALRRIGSQMPQSEKMEKADRVIRNDGGLADLMINLERAMEEEGIA